MRAPFVFLAGLSTLPACAASGEGVWVSETPEAARENDQPAVEASVAEVAAEQEEASAESENGLPAANDDDEAVFQVITLGEGPGNNATYGVEPTVTVNDYSGDSGPMYSPYYYGSPYGYGAVYGYGATYGRSYGGEGSSRRSGAPVQPGQSWPSVPSYGPAFPYNTAPASPWAPAR